MAGAGMPGPGCVAGDPSLPLRIRAASAPANSASSQRETEPARGDYLPDKLSSKYSPKLRCSKPNSVQHISHSGREQNYIKL